MQELRHLSAEGWTQVALAERFGCSPTTVANHLRVDGVARHEGPPLARQAIDEFVADLGELDGEHRALAAIAAALAGRVDRSNAAGSAAMAARVLAELVAQLAGDVRRDQSEERARRALKAIGLS